MKGESAAECPNPDCVAVLRIFMTLNTQSFAKNALCISELNVVSFTGLMKYVQYTTKNNITYINWKS